jgi:toxin ParE1/3/4
MSKQGYIYSKRSAQDLIKIYHDTARKWGIGQADKYDLGLEKAAELLAENPDIGRNCDYIRLHQRRFEHEKHIIFYRVRKDGIFIIRVLHQSMDVQKHL